MPLEVCFQCRVWADLVGVVWGLEFLYVLRAPNMGEHWNLFCRAGSQSLKGSGGVAHHLIIIIRSVFVWAKLGCGEGRPGSLTGSMRRRCAPRSLELRYLGGGGVPRLRSAAGSSHLVSMAARSLLV